MFGISLKLHRIAVCLLRQHMSKDKFAIACLRTEAPVFNGGLQSKYQSCWSGLLEMLQTMAATSLYQVPTTFPSKIQT